MCPVLIQALWQQNPTQSTAGFNGFRGVGCNAHSQETQRQTMTERHRQPLIFTDLDGCLLDKKNYDFSAAIPMLQKLRQMEIPLILCSSKTQAEMHRLSRVMNLAPAPMTCENGGCIVWPQRFSEVSQACAAVPGAARSFILTVLKGLKQEFHFRSFHDLGIDGVMQTTGLEREHAEEALDRSCSEPLLWDDAAVRMDLFKRQLQLADLTLTQGGRFWHVAGRIHKGDALTQVVETYREVVKQPVVTVAIGDSPIDQPMLDIADYSIGIPQPDGQLRVAVHSDPKRGFVAGEHGPAGWALSVGMLLDQLGF